MIISTNHARNTHKDYIHGFKYRVTSTNLSREEQKSQLHTITHNAIFFLLDGELQISCDDHKEITVKPGNLFFLPRGANVSACIIDKKIKYIVARLDHDIDTNSAFIELLKNNEQRENVVFSFESLPIKKPMDIFLSSIKQYINDRVNNKQLQDLKLIELYFIFRSYYTKQECTNLFYPVLKKNSKFKTYILNNFKATNSIEELAQKANMSRSTFDRTFKENFGMTPLKWIESQTRTLIMRKASEPNITVKDIMYDIGIYNPSQFTKLCKRLCGVAPSKLIRH